VSHVRDRALRRRRGGPSRDVVGRQTDREETRSYFQNMAAGWDRRVCLAPEAIDRLAQALDELDIRPGQTVVDAGCGTGVLYPFLEQRIGPGGEVLAVDLAAGMIAVAKSKHGADPRFRWLIGDVVEVLEGLPPGSVDRIVCFSAFPHFADQVRALRAFRRALRSPGSAAGAGAGAGAGRFAVIHLRDSGDLNRFHASLQAAPVSRHVLPAAAELQVLAAAIGFRVLAARECPGLYLLVGAVSAEANPTSGGSSLAGGPRPDRSGGPGAAGAAPTR
jgi:ubiquinone/menaquinone biosynthesis C-methylase UbiE